MTETNGTYSSAIRLKLPHTSFPQMRESSGIHPAWIPAYAGITEISDLSECNS